MSRPLDIAIRRAGAPGGVRFTERQLYHELCRVLQPLHRAPRRPGFTLPVPIGYGRFRAALARRTGVPGLITDVAPRRPVGPGPPDLYDYGLPRLLVCQDRGIAAMLLANDLHMESACPVYCLADLPLDPRLSAALERAGEATVYVLHDASIAGARAVDTVREAFTGLRVSAIGLRPVHAKALHLMTTRGPAGAARASGWEPWELRWVGSGHSAEVAAVNPARLLRTVHRLVRGQARGRTPLPRLGQARAWGFMSWPTPLRDGGAG